VTLADVDTTEPDAVPVTVSWCRIEANATGAAPRRLTASAAAIAIGGRIDLRGRTS
jgi:hypothetical protein